MSRQKLAAKLGERATYRGTFAGYGTKSGFQSRRTFTVLLENVMDADGEIVCDHLWFNATQQFRELRMVEGDLIEFEARVKEYERGYYGHRDDVFVPPSEDYCLVYPTKLNIIRESTSVPRSMAKTPEEAIRDKEAARQAEREARIRRAGTKSV